MNKLEINVGLTPDGLGIQIIRGDTPPIETDLDWDQVIIAALSEVSPGPGTPIAPDDYDLLLRVQRGMRDAAERFAKALEAALAAETRQ